MSQRQGREGAQLPPGSAPVVCDLRAIQSPDHRGRGIGRWSYEFATALERCRPDLVGAYLLDPGWPPPGAIEELLDSGKLAYIGSERADRALEAARVYHCCSVFELARPLSAVRPRVVDQRGLHYSAVAYDLIPLRHPEEYLVDAGQRRRYGARLEVLRFADSVLAISEMVGDEVRRLLGVDPSHCRVIGTGVSRHFVPPVSRSAVLDSLVHSIDELKGPFVLYPAGHDGRKNIEGLITAFSGLPPKLRQQLQLVVVGDLPPLTANHYRYRAELAGIADRLVLTGYVSDERLTELYQATELFVFPSLAEGYGLPIAEALACGAVACVSDLAPFDELVTDRRARFDPADSTDLATVMERCLTDAKLRASLSSSALSTVLSWDDVALRAGEAFDELAKGPLRPWRPSHRVAFLSPLPPLSSGVAQYSVKLIDALKVVAARRLPPGSPRLEIDCYADGLDRYPDPPQQIGGADPVDARAFLATDRAVGSYDHVVYVLGNSDCHTSALAALRRRRGTVLTHDVRLSGLMTFSSESRAAVPGGLQDTIRRSYGAQLPDCLGAGGSITAAERERYGLLLLRDVLAETDSLLVSSEASRRLAELDAGPELAGRIGVLPFAMAWLSGEDRAAVEQARAERRSERPLVASFGIVDPSKRPAILIAAVADLAARGIDVELAFVGPVSEELRGELEAMAGELGVADRTRLLGTVDRLEYLRLLGSAAVAVQLREHFFGEASGAVSECLSAGVPTIVSEIGWMGDLPDKVVAKVAHGCGAAELSGRVEELLGDDLVRSRLSSEGEAFASSQTFEATAEALLEALGVLQG